MRTMSPTDKVTMVGLVVGCLTAGQALAAEGARLLCARVTQPPTLDGRADDTAWRGAKPLEITTKGVMPESLGQTVAVTLRAACSDTHLYLLAQWDDATKSDAGHRTWVWDPDKRAYTEDKDREDMFSVAFEHSGPFTGDMLSGEEAVWDVWHWKAFRTNPQGYAMDKTHRYTRQQPSGRANKHSAKDGTAIWIARPEDSGDTVEKRQLAPAADQGARVPQYQPAQPSGSAADVQAKGSWSSGRWTLEFARKLDTGNPDDTALDPSRSYKMAIGTHNDTGSMDKASSVFELTFAK